MVHLQEIALSKHCGKLFTTLQVDRWTVLGSDRRSDRKSAWRLIGSDRQPDAVIIHSETTQLVTIL